MVKRMQGLHVLPFSDMGCPSPAENTGVTVTVYSVSDCRFFSTVLWVWPDTWTWMKVSRDTYQVLLCNFCSYNISISLDLRWCFGTVFRNYHLLLSSSCRDKVDLVLTHITLSRFPLDIEGTGSGVSDLQVPNTTQRLWGKRKRYNAF